MNAAWLESFLAVSAGNGVRGAAKILKRSPAAISKTLRNLESELGVELFDRSGTRMSLTAEGKVFLPYARRIIVMIREASTSVTQARPPMRLRVGVSREVLNSQVLDAVQKISGAAGSKNTDLTILDNLPIMQSVVDADLDVAFVPRPPRDQKSAASVWNFCQRKLCCVTIYREEILLVRMSDPFSTDDGTTRIAQLLTLGFDHVACFVAKKLTKVAGSSTLQISSEAEMLPLIVAGQAAAALPRSIVDRMPFPTPPTTSMIGTLETIAIVRNDPTLTFLKDLLGRDDCSAEPAID